MVAREMQFLSNMNCLKFNISACKEFKHSAAAICLLLASLHASPDSYGADLPMVDCSHLLGAAGEEVTSALHSQLGIDSVLVPYNFVPAIQRNFTPENPRAILGKRLTVSAPDGKIIGVFNPSQVNVPEEVMQRIARIIDGQSIEGSPRDVSANLYDRYIKQYPSGAKFPNRASVLSPPVGRKNYFVRQESRSDVLYGPDWEKGEISNLVES